MLRVARVVLVGSAAFPLASCMDYLDRRESVSLGAGNAQQANLITHVVNPLPLHAANRQLLFDGQVIYNGVTRYRTGKVAEVTAPPTN